MGAGGTVTAQQAASLKLAGSLQLAAGSGLKTVCNQVTTLERTAQGPNSRTVERSWYPLNRRTPERSWIRYARSE